MALTDGGIANPQFNLDPFQQLVSDRIAELGDDNHPPADRFDFGRQTEDRSFDIRELNSGKIEFGENCLTHRLDVEEFQVVYAFQPERMVRRVPLSSMMLLEEGVDANVDVEAPHIAPTAQLQVYEFSPDGRSLVSRTAFTSTDTGGVRKIRYGNFTSQHRPFISPPELVRDLKATEVERLFDAIIDPGITAIRGIIDVTKKDQKTIDKNRKQFAEEAAEHQRNLESISRSGGVFFPPTGR